MLSVEAMYHNFRMNGMRKIILLLILCVLGMELDAQKTPATGPRLVFERQMHDFGRISHKGGKVTCEFPFTNQGVAPLVITRIQTSCTCTKGSFPKKPIAPGQGGKVEITYDPAQQKGTFLKAIQVYSNGEQKRVIITVKGEVY